jgi:hypothetical protein
MQYNVMCCAMLCYAVLLCSAPADAEAASPNRRSRFHDMLRACRPLNVDDTLFLSPSADPRRGTAPACGPHPSYLTPHAPHPPHDRPCLIVVDRRLRLPVFSLDACYRCGCCSDGSGYGSELERPRYRRAVASDPRCVPALTRWMRHRSLSARGPVAVAASVIALQVPLTSSMV